MNFKVACPSYTNEDLRIFQILHSIKFSDNKAKDSAIYLIINIAVLKQPS